MRQGARLHRALCNVNWRVRFSEASVKHLPAVHSDYCPLLTNTLGFTTNQGDKPFRFVASWMSHENFSDLWYQTGNDNSPLCHFLKNLQLSSCPGTKRFLAISLGGKDSYGLVWRENKRSWILSIIDIFSSLKWKSEVNLKRCFFRKKAFGTNN